MNKKERDDLFAAQVPGVLQYHQQMLSDSVRNRCLYEAIKGCVTPDTTFLDVGAGTGVWAILAARLGAKRVVAVEIEECLIPIIFRHAQENGVADRIEIIHANSKDVKIRGKFDIIVSELFGGEAFGQETVNSFIDVRDRFLAPGGLFIPQKLTMLAAPVHLEGSIADIPAELPIKSEFLKGLKRNYSQSFALADRQRIKLLAEPKELVEVDFRTVQVPPSLANLTGSWSLDDLSRVNGIAMYNRSTFTDDIIMDSFSSQSWRVTVYEIQPFPVEEGELRFSLTIDPQNSTWTAAAGSHPEIKRQHYAPLFAPARIKMAEQMTPYRRFRPPKAKKAGTKSAKAKASKS